MKNSANSNAHIVIDARTSGATTGRYVEKLVENLATIDQSHVYTILVRDNYLATAPALPANFTYHSANYALNGSLGEQTALLRTIKHLSPDIVHFTMPQQPFFYRGREVTTIHDLTGLRFRNLATSRLAFAVKSKGFGWLIKRAAHRSKFVISPTEFGKQEIERFTHISPDKIIVTYEAADAITDPPAPLHNLQNKQFIMYIGRPMPHKNLERLIESFSLLRTQHPDLVLVLAGKKDTNYQRVEASIPTKLRPHIYFTDFVSEGQLRWLYENCAAYVFPSLSEGFGLPGLEAMVHGAPVVSSNATCLPEIYGEAAHYFDPLDVQAMTDAINEVLSNKDLREKLIEAGYQKAATYSWKRMAEQTLSVYVKALDIA